MAATFICGASKEETFQAACLIGGPVFMMLPVDIFSTEVGLSRKMPRPEPDGLAYPLIRQAYADARWFLVESAIAGEEPKKTVEHRTFWRGFFDVTGITPEIVRINPPRQAQSAFEPPQLHA